MTRRMLKQLRQRQQGFTLVELLVAVAILGTVSSALAGLVFATVTNTDDNNGRVEAVTEIEVAAHSISEDGMSAQAYVISGSGNDVITLTWTTPPEEGGNDHQVVYSLFGSNLQRQHSIDGVSSTPTTLAQDVSGLQFTAQGTDAFLLTITSTGGGSRIAETREYSVNLRLSQ